MKILPDNRIQVEAGDTLSGIYGSNWKALSGYTDDPRRLPIGTILPAKPAGSLGGTLPPEGGEKELPGQPVDRLSMFGDVLKMITQRAAKEATARGGEALPEGMLKPEQVSGSTFAGVLNLVTQQKTRGIADIYESTLKMISDSRARADRQLTMLINTGAIAELDDVAIKGLADLTDYPLEYIQSMKTAIQQKREEEGVTKLTDAGRINNLNQFLSDKIGDDGKISAGSYIDAYKRWISLGGAINDFKYAYPAEVWLGSWEYKNLPTGWQPKAGPTVQDVKTLPEEDQILINQVQAKINNYEITYDEAISDFPDYAIYFKPAS